jgi:hypothetical protein
MYYGGIKVTQEGAYLSVWCLLVSRILKQAQNNHMGQPRGSVREAPADRLAKIPLTCIPSLIIRNYPPSLNFWTGCKFGKRSHKDR